MGAAAPGRAAAGLGRPARWLARLVRIGLAIWAATALAVVVAAAWMQHRHGEGRSLAQPVDAAIVLGSSLDPDGVLSYSSRRRVAAGVLLLGHGKARHLIMSGGPPRAGGPSTASLMRDHALALGAPAGAVTVEDRSLTTLQNLLFSLPLADRQGFDRLALVTDSGHLLRAEMLAAWFGRPDIGLVAVPDLEHEGWQDVIRSVARESLAWWYNLGKIALWTLLGWLGMSPAERAEIVQ